MEVELSPKLGSHLEKTSQVKTSVVLIYLSAISSMYTTLLLYTDSRTVSRTTGLLLNGTDGTGGTGGTRGIDITFP